MIRRLCLFVVFVLCCLALVACQVGVPALVGQACDTHRDCGGQLLCVESRCQTKVQVQTPKNTPPTQNPPTQNPPTQKTCVGGGCDCRPQIFQGSLSHHLRLGARQMMYSHDGKLLLSQSQEQTAVWSTSTGQLLALLALDRFQQRHMALSPDSKTLLVGGLYQTSAKAALRGRYVLWDLTTYKQLGEPLDVGTSHDLYVSNGGEQIWLVRSNRISHWQKSTGKWRLLFLEYEGELASLLISSAHQVVIGVVQSAEKEPYKVTVWDVETGKQQKQFVVSGLSERAVGWRPAKIELDATGGRLGLYYDFREQDEAYIVDMTTQKVTQQLVIKDMPFPPNHTNINWSGDLSYLALRLRYLYPQREQILVYQTATGRLTAKLNELTHLDGVVKISRSLVVAVNHDGSQFATSTENGRLGLYKTQQGVFLRGLPSRANGSIDVMFSPKGDLKTLSSGLWMKRWELQDGLQWSGLTERFVPLEGSPRFSPDGSFVTVVDNTSKKIMRWALSTVPAAGFQVLYEASERIDGYQLSHDSRYLAVTLAPAKSSYERVLQIWQLAPRKKLLERSFKTYAVGVAFSHDDKKLAFYYAKTGVTKFDVSDGRLHFFSFETGTFSDAFPLPRAQHLVQNASLLFSPKDNQKVYLSFAQKVALFDTKVGAIVREFALQRGTLSHIALSPNDELLVAVSGTALTWWEVGTGRLVASVPAGILPDPEQTTRSGSLTSLFRFSPDGRTLVLGKADGRLLQWRCRQ